MSSRAWHKGSRDAVDAEALPHARDAAVGGCGAGIGRGDLGLNKRNPTGLYFAWGSSGLHVGDRTLGPVLCTKAERCSYDAALVSSLARC